MYKLLISLVIFLCEQELSGILIGICVYSDKRKYHWWYVDQETTKVDISLVIKSYGYISVTV